MLLFGGVLVGPAIDAGCLKLILIVGNFLVVFGMMMTSLSHEYYQLVLAQGLITGVGSGCIFLPSITIPPQWFSARQTPLALGVVALGSSVGGIIYPAIFHSIRLEVGFGWGVRTLGFFALATNSFATIVLKYNAALPASRRRLFDISMWKDCYYAVLGVAMVFTFIALYIPMFFIQSFYDSLRSTAQHGNWPSTLEFWLLPILMAGSFPGRLVPNMIAGAFGNLNMIIITILFSGILALSWTSVDSVASTLIFALFYGFFSGGTVSLVPPMVVSTAPDKLNLGTRMGMVLTCASLGVLIGNPVAGAILSSGHAGSFTGLQVFGGDVLIVATVCLVAVKILRASGRVDTSQSTFRVALDILRMKM